MKKYSILAAAILSFAANSATMPASGEFSGMPECTGPCSNQVIGDTNDYIGSSADYVHQVNPKANQNGNQYSAEADQRLQQSGNEVNQNNNRLGDATSRGNETNVDASSKATTGASTASVGDVNNVTGPSTSAAKGGDQKQQQGIDSAINNDVGQGQGQDQKQGQKTDVDSNQSMALRNSTDLGVGVDTGLEVDARDQSSFQLDTRDQSIHETNVDARAFYYPSVIPGNPISLASGNLAVTQSMCGPVMDKTQREVLGTFHGWILTNKNVHLGFDEDVIPATDPQTGRIGYLIRVTMRDGSEQVFGSQVTTTHAIINTGGTRAVSVFGSGSSGGSGQVGANNSNAVQQVVLRQTISMCLMGTYKYEIPTVIGGNQ